MHVRLEPELVDLARNVGRQRHDANRAAGNTHRWNRDDDRRGRPCYAVPRAILRPVRLW